MTNHTPGPWWINARKFFGRTYYQVVSRKTAITHLSIVSMKDASLIAAAPQLLEALERAHTYLCDESRTADDLLPVLEKADNAIRKAKGELRCNL